MPNRFLARLSRITWLVAAVAVVAGLLGAQIVVAAQDTAKDPVCGMMVKTTGAKYSSTHDGKTYYFCSEGCKQKFDKEPAKYLGQKESIGSAKDPVCGMTVKTADAKYSSTHDGKTYYFCSEGCKQKFDKEPAKYLKK